MQESNESEDTLENRDTYTLRELFEFLPIPIAELARQSKISEVTLARIRDGKPARRSTVNSLLLKLSDVYNRPLSLRNVTGITIQVNKRLAQKEAREALGNAENEVTAA